MLLIHLNFFLQKVRCKILLSFHSFPHIICYCTIWPLEASKTPHLLLIGSQLKRSVGEDLNFIFHKCLLTDWKGLWLACAQSLDKSLRAWGDCTDIKPRGKFERCKTGLSQKYGPEAPNLPFIIWLWAQADRWCCYVTSVKATMLLIKCLTGTLGANRADRF